MNCYQFPAGIAVATEGGCIDAESTLHLNATRAEAGTTDRTAEEVRAALAAALTAGAKFTSAHVLRPLPQQFGMPELNRDTVGGHYVRVRWRAGKPGDSAYWRREPYVELLLGRGDGVLLYASTQPGSPTAASAERMSEAEFFGRWPAAEDDDHPDHLCLPLDWVRPVADALLEVVRMLSAAKE